MYLFTMACLHKIKITQNLLGSVDGDGVASELELKVAIPSPVVDENVE